MPQQDLPAARTTPAKEIELLSRLTAESAPHNAVLHTELPAERGQDGRVTESVRRVHDVEPSTEAFRIGRAEQQIPDQRLTGWNELVGQHIPGTDLQAARFHERLDVVLALRAHAHIILDEHGLPVEQEGAHGGIILEPLDQVIEGRDQARMERRTRQEPLAVPMRVRYEMKDVGGHGGLSREISAMLESWTCATRRPRARSARMSPRACARCSWPNVQPISGISKSSAGSTVTTRNRPLDGPPL